jgi:hypothetical protein
VDSASELVKLYANKFDLLHTGGAAPKKASSGASAATVKALEELKEVINGHLKVRKQLSACATAAPGYSLLTQLWCGWKAFVGLDNLHIMASVTPQVLWGHGAMLQGCSAILACSVSCGFPQQAYCPS